MKSNIEIKYRWNFLKAAVVISVAIALLMPGSAAVANSGKTAKVQAYMNSSVASTTCDIIYVDTGTIFTIENPPIDFEVVDAEPFDGFGDNGPYSTFNDALLGTLGECRSMAEFDISPFSVPPGEYISSATLEVMITAIEIYGLGVNGETPESLAVDGYVGNGLQELSDFEAGDGNLLDADHDGMDDDGDGLIDEDSIEVPGGNASPYIDAKKDRIGDSDGDGVLELLDTWGKPYLYWNNADGVTCLVSIGGNPQNPFDSAPVDGTTVAPGPPADYPTAVKEAAVDVWHHPLNHYKFDICSTGPNRVDNLGFNDINFGNAKTDDDQNGPHGGVEDDEDDVNNY